MRSSDWSSDVCSSDLELVARARAALLRALADRSNKVALAAAKTQFRPDTKQRRERDARSDERRVGHACVIRVDLGGRRFIKKRTNAAKLTLTLLTQNNVVMALTISTRYDVVTP